MNADGSKTAERRCPSCDSVVDVVDHFCRSCGAGLAPEPEPIAEAPADGVVRRRHRRKNRRARTWRIFRFPGSPSAGLTGALLLLAILAAVLTVYCQAERVI